MSAAVHHVALALAALALGQAALRAVSPVAPEGLQRIVAAAAAGVALAVAEALLLGLVGLGSSPVALVAAAALTWAVAMRLAPAPAPGLRPAEELVAWWGSLGRGARAVAAGLSGLVVAWVAWQLVFPSIGFDSSLYHYPLVAGWVHNGRPGSALSLSYDIPYSAYPQTDEIAQTWAVGIARSWVPFSLWNPALFLLLVASSLVTLRNLSVPRGPALLATAALALTPLAVRQLAEPQTDLPAMAWLACTAALTTGAARRDDAGLLVPALLAGGLAIGTKTSAGPLVVLALLAGAVPVRAQLRRLLPWLALGTAGAVAIGGVWYLRNLAQHGSPFWPFVRGPFGDKQPQFFSIIDRTFLSEPFTTLRGRGGEYRHRLGGGALVLVALPLVVVAAGIARRRRAEGATALVVGTGVALLAALTWSTAWGSGSCIRPRSCGRTGSHSRPCASSSPPSAPPCSPSRSPRACPGSSAGPPPCCSPRRPPGASCSTSGSARRGRPRSRPSCSGCSPGCRSSASPSARAGASGRAWPLPAAATAVLAAIVVGLAVAPASDGYLARYARSRTTTAYGHEVVTWLHDRPGYANGHDTIEIASRGVLAQFAGDHFTHPLALIPQHATCAQVRALARRHDVLVTELPYFRGLLGLVSYSTPACVRRLRPVFTQFAGFRVYRLPPR